MVGEGTPRLWAVPQHKYLQPSAYRVPRRPFRGYCYQGAANDRPRSSCGCFLNRCRRCGSSEGHSRGQGNEALASIRKQRLGNLLHEVEATIAFDQPLLMATSQEDGVMVSGTYVLNPTTDDLIGHGPLARYEVAIRFPPIFPKAEPIVFETGSSIPHDAEYHINPDGTCCIVIWEAWASSTKKISVQDYFDDPLRNYFLGQYQKAATGKWPFGEERHGKEGLIDAFSGRLSCTQNEKRMRYLLRLLSKDWPKGYWDCPCRSGKIVRQCCAKHLARLSQDVPKQDAKRMISRLKSYGR